MSNLTFSSSVFLSTSDSLVPDNPLNGALGIYMNQDDRVITFLGGYSTSGYLQGLVNNSYTVYPVRLVNTTPISLTFSDTVVLFSASANATQSVFLSPGSKSGKMLFFRRVDANPSGTVNLISISGDTIRVSGDGFGATSVSLASDDGLTLSYRGNTWFVVR